MLPVRRHLVTGGAGFIGSHLVHALVQRGDRVTVLDDLSSGDLGNLAALELGRPGSGAPVEFVDGDVADAAAVGRACQGIDGVFHEAAQVSVPQSIADPVMSYRINVMGTLNVLEGARKAGARRFVFAASSAAYGDAPGLPKTEDMPPCPLSPYASGKLAGEALLAVWARTHGLQTAALRYFNVFGPRQADDSPYSGVIALFARSLLDGRRVTIFGDGEQTRDFTHVGDVVQANLQAMEAELDPGEVINVGRGERTSVNQLYRMMAESIGSRLEPEYLPARTGDVLHSQADITRAREKLGYEPCFEVRAGLAETIAWYRERVPAG